MSYRRTVYCGYCGAKGHNRRGCDQRKEYIANNPDSYAARREAIDAERRSLQQRRCSYCGKSGHNVRKCEVKATDKRILKRKLSEQRMHVMKLMVEKGFGVGALVEIETSRNTGTDYYLLTKMDWENTTSAERVRFELAYVPDGRMFGHTTSLLKDGRSYHDVKVLSPADAASIRASFPLDWKRGDLYDAEAYFPKGEGRRYWIFDQEYDQE